MNKSERLMAAALFGALALWMFVLGPKMTPPPQEQTAEQTTAELTAPQPATSTNATISAVPAAAPEQAPTVPEPATLPEEEQVVLKNEKLSITLSSHSGGIRSATLPLFRATQEEDSGPVVFDFSERHTLSLTGNAPLEYKNLFSITKNSELSATITRDGGNGLIFTRVITLEDGYSIQVKDTVANTSPTPVGFKRTTVNLGILPTVPSRSQVIGITTLGVDTLANTGGEDVEHWGKDIASFFHTPENRKSGFLGCLPGGGPSLTAPLPRTIRETQFHDNDTDWIAVKNKFFTQVLVPDETATGFVLDASRELSERETAGGSWDKNATLSGVGGGLVMNERVVTPENPLVRDYHLFIGPKEFKLMEPMGTHMEDIMEWGWFSGICKVLLWGLQTFNGWGLGWGWAIVLLTVIIRVAFMPITRYGTENMKKMQAIQPQMKELQAKHKDDPRKMQRAQAALFKENGVNPLLGCLPMLVQIPFFFALYRMLLSSVDLRYSEWLWISDISDIEALFADTLPIPLNIMPLLMVITMIWQQRLTPQAGDPQMQKMMMWVLPIFMLVFCYYLPAGLMIYWTTSQLLMIITLSHKRLKGDDKSNDKNTGKAGGGKKAQAKA